MQLQVSTTKVFSLVLPFLRATRETIEHQSNGLIESYCTENRFHLRKFVQDAEKFPEIPFKVYKSYKNVLINNIEEGVNISCNIVSSIEEYKHTGLFIGTEASIYLIKMIVNCLYETIKHDKYKDTQKKIFITNIFNIFTYKENDIFPEEFFNIKNLICLNIEKTLLATNFCPYTVWGLIGKGNLNLINFCKIYNYIKNINSNTIKNDVIFSFFRFISMFFEDKQFEIIFSIINSISSSTRPETRDFLLEIKMIKRFLLFLNQTINHIKDETMIINSYKNAIETYLDATPFFNKNRIETNFSTEMFCIVYYLEIYNVLYKDEGEYNTDDGNFLINRIKKSKDNIINSRYLRTVQEIEDETFEYIKKSVFVAHELHIPFINETESEKIEERKMKFYMSYIASCSYSKWERYSNSKLEIFKKFMRNEKNIELFKKKLDLPLIKINNENHHMFNQQFSHLLSLYRREMPENEELLNCFYDVYIEKYTEYFDYFEGSNFEVCTKFLGMYYNSFDSLFLSESAEIYLVFVYLSQPEKIIAKNHALELSCVFYNEILERLEVFFEEKLLNFELFSDVIERMRKENVFKACKKPLTKFLGDFIRLAMKERFNGRSILKRILDIKKKSLIFEGLEKNGNMSLFSIYNLEFYVFLAHEETFNLSDYQLVLESIEINSPDQLFYFLETYRIILFSRVIRYNDKIKTGGRGMLVQDLVLKLYLVTLGCFDVFGEPSHDIRKNESLNCFKKFFLNTDFDYNNLITVLNSKTLVDVINTGDIQIEINLEYSHLREILDPIKLVKAISSYYGRFLTLFDIMGKEYIKEIATDLYEKFKGGYIQEVITKKDLFVFFEIYHHFNPNTSLSINYLSNLLQEQSKEVDTVEFFTILNFIKRFKDIEFSYLIIASQTKEEIRFLNKAIYLSEKEIEKFEQDETLEIKECLFYHIFKAFLRNYNFRHFLVSKLSGLEIMKKILELYFVGVNGERLCLLLGNLFFNVFLDRGAMENFDMENKNMYELVEFFYTDVIIRKRKIFNSRKR